ncbi:hypothetical protein MMC30_006348 [Trapelia coarctata]|nr:hypothetical protein [Trapelia coarctata]
MIAVGVKAESLLDLDGNEGGEVVSQSAIMDARAYAQRLWSSKRDSPFGAGTMEVRSSRVGKKVWRTWKGAGAVSGGSEGMPVGERMVEVVRPVRRSVDQAERYLKVEL